MQMSWLPLLQEAPTWRNLPHASFHHYEAITLACKNLSPLPCASLLFTTNPTEWIPGWLWAVFGGKHAPFTQVNRGGLMRTRRQLTRPIFPSSDWPVCITLWVYRLTLFACREVLRRLQEELLLDPTNTFPFQWSCSLILKPCLFKDIICTAQTWVEPSLDEGF